MSYYYILNEMPLNVFRASYNIKKASYNIKYYTYSVLSMIVMCSYVRNSLYLYSTHSVLTERLLIGYVLCIYSCDIHVYLQKCINKCVNPKHL